MFDLSDIFLYELIAVIILLNIFLYLAKSFPKRSQDLHHVRIQFFDVLKGIAIITIIAIHATDFVPKTQFLKDILWFAIPLFIIESGYLLAVRHDKKINLKEYFMHILTRVVLIYLFFVIIIGVVKNDSFSIKELALDAFLGRTNNNFYFIPIILQLYVLFPILKHLKEKYATHLSLTFVLVFSFFFQVLDFYLQQPEWNSNLYSLAFFGRFLYFFSVGMILAKFNIEKVTIAKLAPFFGLYLVGTISLSLYAKKLYLLNIYPIAIFLLLLIFHNYIASRKKHTSKFNILADIGKHSLVMYLIHTRIQYDLIINLTKNISQTALHSWTIVIYLAIIILNTALSYLFSKVFMKLYHTILSYITEKIKQAKNQQSQLI